MTVGTLEAFPVPPGLDLPNPDALLELLAKVAPISEPWSRFALALMTECRLSPECRELVILRIGWRQQCSYVLSGHLPVARHAGLSEAQISGAFGGVAAASKDSALLRAVDELLANGRVTKEGKKLLENVLSEEEIIELTMLTGQYVLLSMVCATFELRPEPR